MKPACLAKILLGLEEPKIAHAVTWLVTGSPAACSSHCSVLWLTAVHLLASDQGIYSELSLAPSLGSS